jgi:hypothetical protein
MTDDIDLRIKKLAELYRRDQRQFEEERERLIIETIEGFNAEHRKRAYGLQFKIDCQLRPYRDPVMRMNKMVEIFWQGVYSFQEALNNPAEQISQRQQQPAAKILAFRGQGAAGGAARGKP